jgi:magnesium-transporting ATPase (P-type)
MTQEEKKELNEREELKEEIKKELLQEQLEKNKPFMWCILIAVLIWSILQFISIVLW